MTFRDLIGPGLFIDPEVIQASAASGSTRYPYAEWMPIPENEYQSKITPTQLIYHTMSGPELTSIEALFHYIARSDVNGECTFILDMLGRMAQLLEADTRADNNFMANQRAISIETQDVGYIADPGIAKTPWTDPQLAQLAGLSAWTNLRFDVPIERPAEYDDPGMDGHRAHKEWSSFVGKTCPGQTRWEQIPEVHDAAKRIVDWTPPPPTPTPSPSLEDDDMLFICEVDGTVFTGDGVRANAQPGSALATLEANMNVAPRWRHPARAGLPILTDVADIPKINAVQRDLLVGRVVD